MAKEIKEKAQNKITKKFTKKEKKSLTNGKYRRLSIFTVLLVALALALICGIIYGVRYLWLNIKYKEYEDKMVKYGLSELYNNKKATSSEFVTNSEMVKVIIGSLKNERNEDNIDSIQTKEYENQVWVNFALSTGVASGINSKNEKSIANRLSCIVFATNGVENLLREEIVNANLNISASKLAKLDEQEQTKIAKAVTLGIIENNDFALANNKLLKGELNKIIITLVEKYSTMYYKSRSANEQGELIKSNTIVVSDDSLKPSNFEEYPYIINTITNDVYEMDRIVKFKSREMNPQETYKLMSDVYSQVDETISYYLSVILNVDYNDITEESFRDKIKNEIIYKPDEEMIKAYVDYVISNKIKLEGSAKPLLPIMYYNGEQFVVRTKVDFKVISSEVQKDLLFGDQDLNVNYGGKEFSFYVDLPMGQTLNANTLKMNVNSMCPNIVSKGINISTEKE